MPTDFYIVSHHITEMKTCPTQFVLLLLFDIGVKTASHLCHIQLSCVRGLSLGDHHAALLSSQCSPITSTGCQGQRADSIGLECSLFVCVGGWQAICRLFTLYMSLLWCCKSPSVSAHDHLPPGWITSASCSLSVFLSCCMCFILINHRDTLQLLYMSFC